MLHHASCTRGAEYALRSADSIKITQLNDEGVEFVMAESEHGTNGMEIRFTAISGTMAIEHAGAYTCERVNKASGMDKTSQLSPLRLAKFERDLTSLKSLVMTSDDADRLYFAAHLSCSGGVWTDSLEWAKSARSTFEKASGFSVFRPVGGMPNCVSMVRMFKGSELSVWECECTGVFSLDDVCSGTPLTRFSCGARLDRLVSARGAFDDTRLPASEISAILAMLPDFVSGYRRYLADGGSAQTAEDSWASERTAHEIGFARALGSYDVSAADIAAATAKGWNVVYADGLRATPPATLSEA